MMSSNSRRLILLISGVAFVLVVGAGVVVYFVLLNRAESARDAELAEERRRQDELALVRTELDRFSALDEAERARAIWELWLRIHLENWWYIGEHEPVLMSELAKLDGAAFDVLVEDLHEAPSHGANQAAERLRMFGPRAAFALIELLRTGNEHEQRVALSGLWYCSLRLGITDGEREAIRAAVLPLADSPLEWQRDEARFILKYLDD
jgi:hypothetical protein